ncbi:MAG: carbohydrate-binding domain-containing protein [Phycisphaerae bacterium]|nr:carbohydrate-binding domain-containing protein [Phycisphaerae bacterium]
MKPSLALSVVVALVPVASGEMVITEWMYNGLGSGNTGEFVEFTNIGPDPVDMTGWSFDDDSRVPGTIGLSAFGVVAPGQSVVLTDETAADFAQIWGLSGVTIIGGNTANLGRNDEINLYDAGGILVDRLTYGDEDFPGTVRTQNKSCNIPATDYGYTEPQTSWVLAAAGDAYGSKASTRGEVASPGRIVGYALSDFDQDGDVDGTDYLLLSGCLTGPSQPYDPLPAECTLTPDLEGFILADCDQDGDVDASDFGVIQLCYSGEGNPADPSCGRGSAGPVETEIILNGTSITVNGDGVTVDGTRATITSEGSYTITGTLTDGQIVVNTADAGPVRMLLNGVSISNSTSAPVYVLSAASTEVVLVDQTTNILSDATTYVYENPEDDEPNAALFSKDTLIISGTGSLTVFGNYNDAIGSKDELIITGGTLNVMAVDDGIRGKDYLRIQDGDIIVTAGGDALKSDNADDAELGYIAIQNGSLDITSGGDGIAAETDVTITGGDITITSGGGHTATISEDLSAKGIKGLASVLIEGGTFVLDCADDAVHSNDTVTIESGTFNVATGDDAFHSDLVMVINGGTIVVTQSYEGIESADITINDGNIHVTSSDDGINGAGGADGSGGWPPPAGDHYLYIHGGYIVVNAAGDGIDVNGYVVMTGGTVIVHGPTVDFNSAIDYDRTFNISGGILVAAGSAQMAQAPSTTSTQRSVKINYNANKAAGTLAHIQTTAGGTYVVTFAPAKPYRSLVVSCPAFVAGTSCELYRGGSSTGVVTDGLYQGGTYSGGTKTNTFTTNNIVTNVSAP